MANGKQDGSNIVNLEYSTGMCSTRCECCFVNFGDKGLARSKDLLAPKNRHFLRYALAEGQRTGLYHPAPALPPGAVAPTGHELLSGEITEAGTGLFDIPLRAPERGPVLRLLQGRSAQALESWVEQTVADRVGPRPPPGRPERLAEWQRRVRVAERSAQAELPQFPFFVRVSSMSDSLRAPAAWLRAQRARLGENHCFFNTSANTLAWALEQARQRAAVDELHKVVITVNPGRQRVPPFRPAISRPTATAEGLGLSLAWQTEVRRRGYPYGSITTGRGHRHGFLTPLDVGALGELASRVKFWRLRALPTIWPRFATDRPVVVTQLRFKGAGHVFDWCRAYGFHAEYWVGERYWRARTGQPDDDTLTELQRFPGVTAHLWPGHHVGKFVRVWSDAADRENASPYAGEATELVFRGSWYRPTGTGDLWPDWDYVCDRAGGGCRFCGLCATLDGTQRAWTNWANVMPWGEVWPPVPGLDGATYLGELNPRQGGDAFGELLRAYGVGAGWGLEGLGEASAYRLNPPEPRAAGPVHPDEAWGLLDQVTPYFAGEAERGGFCEGWTTHEAAVTLRDFALWSWAQDARRRGGSFTAWLETLGELDWEVLSGADLSGWWAGTAEGAAEFEGEV